MINNKEIKKILETIAKILGEPIKKISIKSKSIDFKAWDSLAQIKIILAVERIVKKKIPSSKIADLNSIRSIIKYLSN